MISAFSSHKMLLGLSSVVKQLATYRTVQDLGSSSPYSSPVILSLMPGRMLAFTPFLLHSSSAIRAASFLSR
jgi:hypothetical protein